MKALVVHTRRTGLGIIRSLGKKGVKVYACDTYKAEGFYSRYTKKHYLIKEMIDVGEELTISEFKRVVKENCSANEKMLLFTPSDDYLLLFVKHWETLKDYFIATFETDPSILKPCLDKTGMYKICEKANVPYPKSEYSPIDLDKERRFPIIVKPAFKKTSKVDIVKQAFRIAKPENQQELKDAIAKMNAVDSAYVVQQYIPGGDDSLYTAGIYAHKGELKAIACGRKLRQFPPNLGECSLGELLWEDKLELYANRLVKESGITGICQLEFKKFEDDFYLMEINPRPWSWISLMEYGGVNLSYIAAQHATNNISDKLIKQDKYKGNWFFPTMDLKHNVLVNKNTSVLQYIKSLFTAKRLAFWSVWDPIPLFVHAYYAYQYEFRRKK